jgi:hypothetical protein
MNTISNTPSEQKQEFTVLDRSSCYNNWHRGFGIGCWHTLEIQPLLIHTGNKISINTEHPRFIALLGRIEEKTVRALVGSSGALPLPFSVNHVVGFNRHDLPFEPKFNG